MNPHGSVRRKVFPLAAAALAGALLAAFGPAFWTRTSGRFETTTQAAEPARSDDPLAELDLAFREVYAKGRQEMLARSGPVILVEGDNLVLLRNGKRSEARVIPERYHTLKAVSHSTLAIFVMLYPYGEGPIDEKRLETLRGFRARLEPAAKTLKERGLPEDLLREQEKLIAASQQFLGRAIEAGKVKNEDLTAFARAQAPLIWANVAEAVRAQLEGLDRQVRAWRAEMSPEDWKRVHVLILDSPMPRKGNICTQYFARLLGEPGESPRIIYAESIREESRALSLLGTHLLDTQIGAVFFDDPERMLRDLLADAALAQLKKMKMEP